MARPVFGEHFRGGFNHPVWASYFEVGLGIRAGFSSDSGIRWLSVDLINQMAVELDAQRRPVLSERRPDGKVYQYTYDPAHGYALVKYRVVNPPGVSGYDPIEVEAQDFRVVGDDNVVLPFTIIQRGVRNDGTEAARWTMTVRSYKLDDPANRPERYRLRWPADIEILDRRTMTHVRTREEGVLDEARLAELILDQERRLGESLLGPTTRPTSPAKAP